MTNTRTPDHGLDAGWNASELWDISSLAKWSLSTCKDSFGIDRLRDDNPDTYWQSDGTRPHFVNITLHKCCTIAQISLYLDYKQDESYTPQTIAISAGSRSNDRT
ncbi:hypothetical protein BSLG_003117 [Batrachochytrium salamandrivorans]|nr:hypothetical protein BSLG_003117 [Batrachochytrium salamandrivorans]